MDASSRMTGLPARSGPGQHQGPFTCTKHVYRSSATVVADAASEDQFHRAPRRAPTRRPGAAPSPAGTASSGRRSGGRLAACRAAVDRALADQLGLSRGVVVEAYEQLVAEGYLPASRVAPRGSAAAASGDTGRARARPRPRSGSTSSTAGRTSPSRGQPWLRSFRRVLETAPSDRSLPRRARRARAPRGARDVPQPGPWDGRATRTIVICNGFAQGLALSIAAVKRAAGGGSRVEDPGTRATTLRKGGPRSVPVPVDDEGLGVDALERPDADAVVVTPAHQYPTGAVAVAGAPCGAGRLGDEPAGADPRGRLRRRVPLRPRADRRDPRTGAGARHLRRLGSKTLAPGCGWAG